MAEDDARSEAPSGEKTTADKLEEDMKKYGLAYAVMSDAFKGKGIDMTVRLVSWALAAFAVFVVIYAVWSSL